MYAVGHRSGNIPLGTEERWHVSHDELHNLLSPFNDPQFDQFIDEAEGEKWVTVWNDIGVMSGTAGFELSNGKKLTISRA